MEYSLSSLNFTILRPSAKLHLPGYFVTSKNSLLEVGAGKKNPSLNYTLNGHTKLREIRAATTQVHEQDDGAAVANEGHDAVMKSIEEAVEYIRRFLKTTGDGRISVSAYDTAWVAMIKDMEGRDAPQFPASLEWIIENQLADGSWGDDNFFSVYDRLVNTIACVVALGSWNVQPYKLQKGVAFIKENVDKFRDGEKEHMTCGFELVFPALLQRAQSLGIQGLSYDAPVINQIYQAREQKLQKIPLEMMHKVSTTLLFSLEGLENVNLEWDKLLKLRCADGSFLTSPSSTAYAFMHTQDHQCFQFIKNIVHTFNGGAPHAYPVDLFARLWAVDRLQRLGISRFFHSEIANFLAHVHKFWTENGIFSARESRFSDMDDTSMGFRLLRMHGYHVDPNVLRKFETNEGKFSCFVGQMLESPTPIYNLYEASQLRFLGEEILQDAYNFAYDFLQQKLATNQILDKWVISKHLPHEIKRVLEMPWYATLPRVEARYYLQYYGGSHDVWIGKTLNRMPDISNDTYKELAIIDFKRCQAQHQSEWMYMQEWYERCNIEQLGISRNELLLSYFLAAATIFEVVKTKERIAWAKSQIISKMTASFFNNGNTSSKEKHAFLTAFRNNSGLSKNLVLPTLTQFLEQFDTYTSHHLKNAWSVWLAKLQGGEGDGGGADAELLTNTLNICAGHIVFKEELLSHNDYKTLSILTSKICQQLSQIQNEKELESTAKTSIKNKELEQDMQTLVKLVLNKSNGVSGNIKNTFLEVAKSYYYRAYHSAQTIRTHMFKVLFEPIV